MARTLTPEERQAIIDQHIADGKPLHPIVVRMATQSPDKFDWRFTTTAEERASYIQKWLAELRATAPPKFIDKRSPFRRWLDMWRWRIADAWDILRGINNDEDDY